MGGDSTVTEAVSTFPITSLIMMGYSPGATSSNMKPNTEV